MDNPALLDKKRCYNRNNMDTIIKKIDDDIFNGNKIARNIIFWSGFVILLSLVITMKYPVLKPSLKIDTYSVSGIFEKMTIIPLAEKKENERFSLYFISDFDKTTKKGIITTGSKFFEVKDNTVTPGNYSNLRAGDKIVVYSSTDMKKGQDFIVKRFELIK